MEDRKLQCIIDIIVPDTNNGIVTSGTVVFGVRHSLAASARGAGRRIPASSGSVHHKAHYDPAEKFRRKLF